MGRVFLSLSLKKKKKYKGLVSLSRKHANFPGYKSAEEDIEEAIDS